MERPSYEEVVAENAELKRLLAVQGEQIAVLQKIVEEVRRRGKRQSAPFSKGDPKPDPKKPGRKSGDAHGRHAHRVAPDAVDRELEAPLPDCCPDCGGGIEFEKWMEQFQTELPDPRPVVTRFRVGVGRCAGCRRRVQGRHPEQTGDGLGAASAQVGPNARAMGQWMHYVLGLSFAKAAAMLGRLGVPVTAGALASGSQRTGLALVPTTRAIEKAVAVSPSVTMDETGWRVCGRGAWLWAAATPTHTVYKVRYGRGFAQACDLVPADYAGTIIRDGWAPYRSYVKATHQTCLAHLLRRTVEMIEADTPGGWAFPKNVKNVFLEALAARDLPGEDERVAAAARFGARIDLLIAGPHLNEPDRKLAKHLTNERGHLFSFLTVPGVEATNWRGEQAMRPGVVNRKVWGGNRTDRGARTQSTMMTFFRTAHLQGVDPIGLLLELARAPAWHTLTGLVVPAI